MMKYTRGTAVRGNERELITEVRAFLRGGQLHLLARVLPNIALHFRVQPRDLPRMLWIAGLSMKEIEKQVESRGGPQANRRKKSSGEL